MGGGESYTELQTRVVECICEIARNHKNKHVLVVSTSEIYRARFVSKVFELGQHLVYLIKYEPLDNKIILFY